jgi:hypothetical protein
MKTSVSSSFCKAGVALTGFIAHPRSLAQTGSLAIVFRLPGVETGWKGQFGRVSGAKVG